MTFEDACSTVGEVIAGDARREIVASLATATELSGALRRLRDAMRVHTLRAGARTFNLAALVAEFDTRTTAEGFHALNDWNGVAGRVNDDTIPVEVTQYLIERRGADRVTPALPGILLDYYLMYLLALLSLRAWDDGRANENLDRLTSLLVELQGPNGSGQLFATDAETLFVIATSHYEPDEHGYDRLLDQVRGLNAFHRTAMGLVHASSMGCHLRFGFEATYNHDIIAQRDDNVVDYPWVVFGIHAAMREYRRMHEEGIPGTERQRVVEALFNGLSADAAHFVKAGGGALAGRATAAGAELEEVRDLFQTYRAGLAEEFERLRPLDQTYSPLSLFYNFAQNVVKGTVVDALLWGEPWPISLNDMLTGVPGVETQGRSREALAKTLMGYARANPDTIRGRKMPVIVYDPPTGRRAFATTMRSIKAASA